MWLFILAYSLLGLVAGVMAGLMGIGGGLVIVPALIALFHYQGFDPAVITHVAVGSSLATIIPTAVSSTLAHHRRQAVDWSAFSRLAPGLVIGAVLGALLADQMNARWLQVTFGVFLMVVAAQMLWGTRGKTLAGNLPGLPVMVAAGGIIGGISGLVGIGGGTMTVPFLHWFGKPLPKAVATSAACGLPIALSGTVGFMVFGAAEQLPASTGYVYWPAVLVVALCSILTAPLGAGLAHSLPVATLKKIFALLLLLVGLRLVY